MLEHAIDTGRGGVFLRLTPEQYGRLRQHTLAGWESSTGVEAITAQPSSQGVH